MLGTIYIGMSGLDSYSRGLKTISNNVTNLNTPGFKTGHLQFTDMFYQGEDANTGTHQHAQGVSTLNTSLNFAAGDFRNTGNPLDVAIDGRGFFVLRDEHGNITYTKAGQFEFNDQGILVNRVGGEKVMGFGSNGQLQEISLAGVNSSKPKASASVVFKGNLSSGDSDHTINNVSVFDNAGKEHVLKILFNNKVEDAATGEVKWDVTISEDGASPTTGNVKFKNSLPVIGSDSVSMTFSPVGVTASTVVFKLGSDVTGYSLGADSSLAVNTKDGYGVGTVTGQSFDEEGKLVLKYSNGQTDKPFQLAMARFDSFDSLQQIGNNQFSIADLDQVRYGVAGKGQETIKTSSVEISNVDLSQEFSDLILMQRGYQASSQMVSAANEMIQQLLEMKGR
ncbi:flagellar hook protein FlgE [Andreprevotia lacus DSM 23236]|jgi:flagellar hook protein FlgE|uniref:Flagellar basal-body rod protein FlgF n=1 Tax=Andreprevotia lacus DSM 23236 TaxID=1121001 RepID=A0A1W1XUN6_9NEIS|nr:flagellar basal-body rod protein FlgF [Andreprevotia lacus]SMC27673.1 flagellar hook protein FlgE [Andreprevotia lacus DSM 23236]